MASQNELKKTAIQYQIEERRRQVMILLAQGMTEIEIGKKLGVDNSTISKDIKALKLISQQFIYDITKSDFTLLSTMFRISEICTQKTSRNSKYGRMYS